MREYPLVWQGLCNESQKAYVLTQGFVDWSFFKSLQEQIITIWNSGKRIFITNLPGSD